MRNKNKEREVAVGRDSKRGAEREKKSEWGGYRGGVGIRQLANGTTCKSLHLVDDGFA